MPRPLHPRASLSSSFSPAKPRRALRRPTPSLHNKPAARLEQKASDDSTSLTPAALAFLGELGVDLSRPAPTGAVLAVDLPSSPPPSPIVPVYNYVEEPEAYAEEDEDLHSVDEVFLISFRPYTHHTPFHRTHMRKT